MPIIAQTEIVHPELGPIWFDDGKPMPEFASRGHSDPQWICRPEGRNSDFEILLPCGDDSPAELDRAIEAMNLRSKIESQGKALGDGDIWLAWIDLTKEPFTVHFADNDHIYVLWTGKLNTDWQIEDFTQGNW